MSISFDRAAEYYDETRRMPPADVTRSIIDLTNATPDSRLLEIGIGTGRIALPLAKSGYDITGVDLSRLMMEQLVKKTVVTHRSDLPLRQIKLAQADMAHLPLKAESYDGVIAVHVLHLSPAWREAVTEVRRVLKAGAPLLASWHHRETYSPVSLLRGKLAELALGFGVDASRPGAAGNEDIRDEFEKWGTGVELVDVVSWEERITVGEILDTIDRRIFSDTWLIPRAVMDKIMPELRAFAFSEFGEPGKELVEPATFTWVMVRK